MNLIDAISFTNNIRKRQYITGKVGALDFKYLPQQKQLYIASQARSSDGRRIYKASIVFEGITNSETVSAEHKMPYYPKENQAAIFIQQPTVSTRFRARCQCQDYYFMFEFWNKREKALIGPHKQYVRVSPPSGRPPVNPTESPGCCKHICGLIKYLMLQGIVPKDSIVWTYVSLPPRLQQ